MVPPRMAIFLIRHGETDSNAARIVQTPDMPLSAPRRRQAEAARAAARGRLGVATILSSDLRRAVMTAERVHEPRPARRSRSTPACRSATSATSAASRTPRSASTSSRPTTSRPAASAGRSFIAASTRRGSASSPPRAATDGNLAVVTHGLVCYSLALRHLQLPRRRRRRALAQRLADRRRRSAAVDRARAELHARTSSDTTRRASSLACFTGKTRSTRSVRASATSLGARRRCRSGSAHAPRLATPPTSRSGSGRDRARAPGSTGGRSR